MLAARAYASRSYGLSLVGQITESGEFLRKAVNIREQIAADAPDDSGAQRELANVRYRLGVMGAQNGHPDTALTDLREALRIQLEQEAKHPDVQLRSDIASTHHFLGISLGALGRYDEALAEFRAAIAIREPALAADERDGRSRSLLAGNYAEQADVLLRARRLPDALASIRHAISLQRQTLSVDPRVVPVRINLASYSGRLATIYGALGATREAAETWATARTLFDQLAKEGHLTSPELKAEAEHARVEAARTAAAFVK
jgi:tetratricopeptide (TPR) repeat protein